MTPSLRLVNRGVKQAGFYVLGGAAMPAVLIEIGFLTNPREEKKLATSEHREAIARAIYASLAEYKRRYDQRVRTVQSQPLKAATQRWALAAAVGLRVSCDRSGPPATISVIPRAPCSWSSVTPRSSAPPPSRTRCRPSSRGRARAGSPRSTACCRARRTLA